jgi:tetratricopeptide (TPR) repeat protein
MLYRFMSVLFFVLALIVATKVSAQNINDKLERSPEVFTSVETVLQDTPFTDCDRYAASEVDEQRKGSGILFNNVDPELAIPACLEAVSRYPNTARFIYQLGRAYQSSKDFTKASELYRKASDAGYAVASTAIGAMHQYGLGVPKSESQAVAWFRRGAEQGNALGRINLAIMYLNGFGVPKDYNQAATLFRQAAEQGNTLAQANLGSMYQIGLGVSKDDFQAVAWFRKSADGGNAFGQFKLGTMYASGLGVSEDIGEAKKWYQKAADQGFSQAKSTLDDIEKSSLRRVADKIEAHTAITWVIEVVLLLIAFVLLYFIPRILVSRREQKETRDQEETSCR